MLAGSCELHRRRRIDVSAVLEKEIGAAQMAINGRHLGGGFSPSDTTHQPGEHDITKIDCTLLSSGPIS
jgi:hypothetical protein